MKAFTLVETKITVEEVTVNTYGINNGNICVDDISTDKTVVETLISELNSFDDIADCHIFEIIEDSIDC